MGRVVCIGGMGWASGWAVFQAHICIRTQHTLPLPIKNQYFAREKDRLLSEVDAKGSELAHALSTFQEAFDTERRERLEREGRILRQLGEHEQEVARRFEAERVGGYWVVRLWGWVFKRGRDWSFGDRNVV